MSSRSATALPAVLFAMALASALVAGSVHAAQALRRSARESRSAAALGWPVERVLIDLIVHWDTTNRPALPIGGVVLEPSTTVDGVPVTASITRLNEHLYWMVAVSWDSTSTHVSSRLGILVQGAEGQIHAVPGAAWTRLP